MDFPEAAAFLDDAERFGINPSLDGIRALMDALGSPQSAYSAIQVAGTNGKTSVTTMIGSLMEAHGERAGVFVSPRLGARTSQFTIGGSEIGQDAFARAVSVVAEAVNTLPGAFTEFELCTATALVAFLEAGVTWAILEVGMGGRWDATSVVTPRVAVVTGVDLDHTQHLGASVEVIAEEKAAILCAGGRAILGPGVRGVLEVFLRRADEVGAPVTTVLPVPSPGDVVYEVLRARSGPDGVTSFAVSTPRTLHASLSLAAPAYQVANAAVAIAAAEAALGHGLDTSKTAGALAAQRLPGRFEVLSSSPMVIVDGAHNPAAAAVLAEAIAEAFAGERPLAVLGVLDDKDATGIVQALAPVVSGFVATRSASPRALHEHEVATIVESVTGLRPPATGSVADAMALARESGLPVLATGSLTIAAEARDLLGAG